MLTRLAQMVTAGETVALATVIRVLGSVPREVGTKMIVHPEGRHVGTVGGGCGEAAVIRAALDVLASGAPVIVSADLTGDVTTESGAICGGMMDVFVERLPNPRFALAHLRAAIDAMAQNETVVMATVVAAPQGRVEAVGAKRLFWSSGGSTGSLGLGDAEVEVMRDALHAYEARVPQLRRYGDTEARSSVDAQGISAPQAPVAAVPTHYVQGGYWCFLEPLRRPPRLIIVGAGHIAQPLAEIAHLCDFSVTILDDRAQFANSARFPTSDVVLVGPLSDTLRDLAVDRDTYIVLITRGHQHDMECLLELVNREVAYIGMIGSRRRVRGVFQLLEKEHSIARRQLQRVFAPVGLDIGAQTPAEIAVTIMAEVINVHRDGRAPSLSDDWRLGR